MFREDVTVTHLTKFKILRLGNNRPITQTVSDFYSTSPFPDYEDLETLSDLLKKLESNRFFVNIKKSISLNKKIIEVGCGTAQTSIALASGTNNHIVAFDSCIESLKIGEAFAVSNSINNCTFVNGDLFDDPFVHDYFDIVWSSGVLHHTANAKDGFKVISNWVKPGGYIILGLYNQYGRLRSVLRRKVHKLLRKSEVARRLIYQLDPILRKPSSDKKKIAWFRDQYEHPVESLHTLDEVLSWFEENDIEYINSIPSCDLSYIDYENIFQETSKGDVGSRVLSQISMLFSTQGGEGGLFVVIGKKLTSH